MKKIVGSIINLFFIILVTIEWIITVLICLFFLPVILWKFTPCLIQWLFVERKKSLEQRTKETLEAEFPGKRFEDIIKDFKGLPDSLRDKYLKFAKEKQ